MTVARWAKIRFWRTGNSVSPVIRGGNEGRHLTRPAFLQLILTFLTKENVFLSWKKFLVLILNWIFQMLLIAVINYFQEN